MKQGEYIRVEKQEGKTVLTGTVIGHDINKNRTYFIIKDIVRMAQSLFTPDYKVGDIRYIESKGEPRKTLTQIHKEDQVMTEWKSGMKVRCIKAYNKGVPRKVGDILTLTRVDFLGNWFYEEGQGCIEVDSKKHWEVIDMNKIKVGSKWDVKGGNIVREVVAVHDNAVFTIDINDKPMIDPRGWYEDEFSLHHVPHTPFEWKKHHFYQRTQMELAYNYKRYFEQMDYTVELNNFYTIGLMGEINYIQLQSSNQYQVGAFIFSTREHAETFRDMAKENGCL